MMVRHNWEFLQWQTGAKVQCFNAYLAGGICVRPCRQRTVPITNDPPLYGPWNGTFFSDGTAVRAHGEDDSVLRADSALVDVLLGAPGGSTEGLTLLAGAGNVTEQYPRYLPQMRTTSRFGWARTTAFRQRQAWSLDNGNCSRRPSTALNSAFISMERRWAVAFLHSAP